MQNELKVFVITRFGLGQSSKKFYDQELPYFEKLLIKSVLKQKKHIKRWIILVDINTPKYVIEKISKLIPENILYIFSHDPFVTGSVMPNISLVIKDLGVKNNDKVITIRVDADDMLSDNYISSVNNIINDDDLINKYKEISIDATLGVYFYPIRNKFIKVSKKGYSVQALYSIFDKNFHSVYDYSHQKLAENVKKNGGFCCQLNKNDYWIRSMRQHSVTRFGKKIGFLEGRLSFVKNIFKLLFYKFFENNTFYRGNTNIDDLSDNFQLSNNLLYFFENLEKNFETKKTNFSPLVNEIINTKKVNSPLKVKNILLEMYKIESDEGKKANIRNEFYNF